MKSFTYEIGVDWTGNDGSGTTTPHYGRDNEVSVHGKPTIVGSAPKEFGGNGTDWSPEEFFVAAISQCHMLTYLYLCSRAGIVVESYNDLAVGTLRLEGTGGQVETITLRPRVVISAGDPERAKALHADAHRDCFIGASITASVVIEPAINVDRAG